jgi:hypothetical protein
LKLASAAKLARAGTFVSGDLFGNNLELPMGRAVIALAVAVFLLAPPALVHWWDRAEAQSVRQKSKTEKTAEAPLEVHYGTDGLPEQVRELREALLEAVRSGKIEDLRYAYDLNDIKPDLGSTEAKDPIAHWKKISGDGEGREVLAALSLILDTGHVVLPLGADLENNRLYIWPYFSEVPLDKLTPAQEVELLRLVPPAAAKSMKSAGKYTHWRLTIGADGAWHSFRKSD